MPTLARRGAMNMVATHYRHASYALTSWLDGAGPDDRDAVGSGK
jgi:hypothetical protein